MSTFEIVEDGIVFRLDSDLYKVDCVIKTAHLFLDRYYIYLGQEDHATVVTLMRKEKDEVDEEAERAVFGEFCNELLNQIVHQKPSKDIE